MNKYVISSIYKDNYIRTMLKLAKLYYRVGEFEASKQLKKKAKIRYYDLRRENG